MGMLKERSYRLWLSTIPGIGEVKRGKLLERFKSAKALFECPQKDLLPLMYECGCYDKEIQILMSRRCVESIDSYEARLTASKVGYWVIDEETYPQKLKQTYGPPDVLYYRGHYQPTNITIAIVGARQMSPYGQEVASYLGRELSKAGIHVVSGMARGIDSAAHWGALKNGYSTTAVWGSGINVCYPKESRGLEKSILEHGAILSENGLDIAPHAGLFPRRNRIISGLCDGIVIVEAKDRSGSLITADCALEQGRDVFAVPGRIFDKNSEGTNKLIQNGAKPLHCVDDILEDYGILIKEKGNNETDKEKRLDEKEKIVYSCIRLDPVYIDEIMIRTRLAFGELQLTLIRLELAGHIRQLPNQFYIRSY